MDKKIGLLNVIVSLTFKVITMIMSIWVKRLLILNCGNEVNGLHSLYQSVIGVLSVVELGVGSAITFCMYKPIVEQDHNQVSALYQLFRRSYLLIGSIIAVGGLLLIPFLQFLAKDYALIDANLYKTFLLMLVSVVITYLFSSKISLINAYKNNYITTAITSGGIVLQYILQIFVLTRYQSFEFFLICRINAVLIQWVATEIVARKKYRHILVTRQQVSRETKAALVKSIKAMFMHKIGVLLVNTADSIIISVFIGVVALGTYSNYSAILTSMTGILQMIFTSLTTIIGHLYVKEDQDISRKYCDLFHYLNFMIASVFMLGYYAIIDELVCILFGENLVCVRMIPYVITLNGFVQFLRRSVLMFRDATGTFYYDRWKPIVEGTINIVLSVLLLKWIGVTGVIVATIITNLVLCHIIEPYVLYRYAFSTSPQSYYMRNYSFIICFCAEMHLLDRVMIATSKPVVDLLCNGVISVMLSSAVCLIVFIIARKQTGSAYTILFSRERSA